MSTTTTTTTRDRGDRYGPIEWAQSPADGIVTLAQFIRMFDFDREKKTKIDRLSGHEALRSFIGAR